MKRAFHRTVTEKILFVLAWLVLGLAVVGVVLPLLPTTPLVLLASALFAKSSPRFDAWLRGTRLYKSYVVPFRATGGMTAAKKLKMFGVTAATCAVSFYIIDVLAARVVLVTMVACMGVALTTRIRTITPEEEAQLRS